MKVDKRVVLSSAVVLGVAALIAGSTIAYFTDKDSATNNFTIGNVNITLYESQLHRVNSNVKPQYSETSNASPVNPDNYNNCLNGNVYCTPNIPVSTDTSGLSAWLNGHVRLQNVPGGGSQAGAFSDAQIIADADIDGNPRAATATTPGNYAGYVASEYQNLVPGQQVRKFVYVKNEGDSSAYLRVKVTIPSAVANLVTVKAPHTPQEECALKSGTTECQTGAANENIDHVDFSNHKYLTQLADTTDNNGNKVMTFIYTDALKPGEMTYWSPITTVKINDNAKLTDFNTTTIENGFGITVDADAIQAGGFASATAAFEAYDAQN
jgi:predicted ribosomally synthesized peptide with SipW-like signal peptide